MVHFRRLFIVWCTCVYTCTVRERGSFRKRICTAGLVDSGNERLRDKNTVRSRSACIRVGNSALPLLYSTFHPLLTKQITRHAVGDHSKVRTTFETVVTIFVNRFETTSYFLFFYAFHCCTRSVTRLCRRRCYLRIGS